MRGVVLVAIAAVLGFFVLRAIDDTGGGPSIADLEAATDTTGAETDTSGATDTTAAAPQPRPPGEVIVLVANASGVQGAAGAQSEAIAGGGYQVAEPTNASAEVEATQVLATAGFEADATALAAAIGAPEGAVAPMPDPPPVPDLAGANLVVLLGPDLAGAG